jgi:hypothetical protein
MDAMRAQAQIISSCSAANTQNSFSFMNLTQRQIKPSGILASKENV